MIKVQSLDYLRINLLQQYKFMRWTNFYVKHPICNTVCRRLLFDIKKASLFSNYISNIKFRTRMERKLYFWSFLILGRRFCLRSIKNTILPLLKRPTLDWQTENCKSCITVSLSYLKCDKHSSRIYYVF